MSTEIFEIERMAGFANANGDSFLSANAAYNAYLNASGQKPDRKNKGRFKAWLKTAKDSGQLEKMLKKGGAAIKAQVDKKNADIKSTPKTPDIDDRLPDPPAKKKIPLSGVQITGIIVGAVIVIGIGVAIYRNVKKNKAQIK